MPKIGVSRFENTDVLTKQTQGIESMFNPLTAGNAYIRVLIFLLAY